MLGHDKTIRLIRSGSIRPPIKPSKGQSGMLLAIDHSVAGSMTAQPPGSRLSALWFEANRWPHQWGGILLLCRSAVIVFYSSSRQGGLFSRSGPQQQLAVCKTSKECSRNEIWLQWKSDIWNWSIFSGQRQIILQKRYHPRRRLCWILPKSCCFIS